MKTKAVMTAVTTKMMPKIKNAFCMLISCKKNNNPSTISVGIFKTKMRAMNRGDNQDLRYKYNIMRLRGTFLTLFFCIN